MTAHFPGLLGSERLHLFDQAQEAEDFDLERYYNPDDSGTRVTLRNVQFVNSAAIGLYPLLSYMGFKEVFFFGMDMSMLGSFEYAAPYSFKTMLHFRGYFWRTQHVFNANYVRNPHYYLRPPYEFENIKELPEDLADAFEAFKLAILQHKTMDWQEISREDVLASLDALKELASTPTPDEAPF